MLLWQNEHLDEMVKEFLACRDRHGHRILEDVAQSFMTTVIVYRRLGAFGRRGS